MAENFNLMEMIANIQAQLQNLGPMQTQLQHLGDCLTKMEQPAPAFRNERVPKTQERGTYKAEKKVVARVVEPKPPDHGRDLYGSHHIEPCQGRYKIRSDYYMRNEPKLFGFSGGRDPRVYIRWEQNMDEYFEYKAIPRDERLALSTCTFVGEAKTWWLQEKDTIWSYGKPTTRAWERLKEKMRRRFAPDYQPQGQPSHPKKTTPNKKRELQGSYANCKSSKHLEAYGIIRSNHGNMCKVKEKSNKCLATLPTLELNIKNSKLEDNLERTDYTPSTSCIMHLSCPKVNDAGSNDVETNRPLNQPKDVLREDIPAGLPPQREFELQCEQTLGAPCLGHLPPHIQTEEKPLDDGSEFQQVKCATPSSSETPRLVENTLTFYIHSSMNSGFDRIANSFGDTTSCLEIAILMRELHFRHSDFSLVHTYLHNSLGTMIHLFLAKKCCFVGTRKKLREDQWIKEKPPDLSLQVQNAEKTPEHYSARKNFTIDLENSVPNFIVFYTHVERLSKWNNSITSLDEGVMNFASQTSSSNTELDQRALFGVQRKDQKELGCETNYYEILTHRGGSETLNHFKATSYEELIEFSRQDILHLPHFEADDFGRTQQYSWRPGELLHQLEDPRRNKGSFKNAEETTHHDSRLEPQGKVDMLCVNNVSNLELFGAGNALVLRTKPLEEGGNDETLDSMDQQLVSVEHQGTISSSRARAMKIKPYIFMHEFVLDGATLEDDIAWMIAWIADISDDHQDKSVWTLLSHGREGHGVFTITQW